MPENILKQYSLVDINMAIKQIHFPMNFDEFKQARTRLVFEELFTMQLALLLLKTKYEKNDEGIMFSKNIKMNELIQNLPFKLTNAQNRVLNEIEKDMESSKPMNRLLQGDVGSRKNNCKYSICL